MMRAMPYNLQAKGVVEVSGISTISQPKWKNLDKLQQHHHHQHQQQQAFSTAVAAASAAGEVAEEEEELEQFQIPIITKSVSISPKERESSSIESEPTSTLDTTTLQQQQQRSPSSPPTSTSTLSSSFTGGKNSGNGGGSGSGSSDNTAGVADPACARKEDWPPDSDNVAGGGGGGGANSGGGSGLGLEEWDSMFPNGDGSLLPWIMGESDDLAHLGLKHLLQSGNPVVEFEGNAGLGVVDQGSGGLDSLSPPPPPPPQIQPPHPLVEGNHTNGGLISASSGANLGFPSSGFGSNTNNNNNGKPNSSSGVLDCKVSNNGLQLQNPNCNNNNLNFLGSIPASLQPGVGGFPFPQQFDVGNDEKPQIFNPQLVMNPQQAQSMSNPSFMMSPLGYCQLEQHLFQPQAKRHNPGVVLDPNLIPKNPFLDHEMLLRKQQQQQQMGLQQLPMGLAPHHPLMVPQQLQQKPLMVVQKQNHHQQQQQHFPLPVHQQQQLQEQVVKDQLFKAADLIQTGNFSLAQEILARLNHQLSLQSKPPLIRAALYIKEALQMLLLMSNPVAAPPLSKTLTPYDVVHKMNAYKVFSEVSPITQFVNFTCTQAILEALDDADAIHIIDFDIGCGAQWASLIQELPLRKRGAPSLKITALASLSTSHPFELSLIRENLVQFANDIGVAFELQVVNLDLFDPSSSSLPNFRTSEDESIAVSIPIWASSNRPSVLPSILRFIKQRSPKIVVSLDRGFDRCDVPFPQHLLHTLESCTNYLESLDGLSVASDIISKVEKFFIQPRIENTVLGRVNAPDKMPHWKSLFASAGLLPVQFSNFTETQADYVVKRTPGRGFHVEKRQASLVLSWQRRELVAASAWRC